jgi:hypothetical protein
MFILKRQDVEVSSVQHPKSGQQIPILTYQGQTFRLITVFNTQQADEARAFWRELTDNRGKACVLLEEEDRYSVWGKVRLEQLKENLHAGASGDVAPFFTQACLLLLQAVYFDVEDLLGTRQAGSFQKELANVLSQWRFPQAEQPQQVKKWLEIDPLEDPSVPNWQEHHLITLLQELHRLGKSYFGNASFTERALDILEDMEASEKKQFLDWMKKSPLGKLWTVA